MREPQRRIVANGSLMRAPQRLFLLDALRGLAAVAVVIFHWQFWGSDSNRLEPAGGFPLYRAAGESLLAFFYQSGAEAVRLFFTLSGFVFFWLFGQPVRSGAVSGWQFFVDRFSRLYPLHLATLVVVAIEQHFYASMNHGAGWNSPVNSASNFVKQLLIVPLWTAHRDVQFNLPVWSLVVEALVYVLFFAMASRVRVGVASAAAGVLLGVAAGSYSEDIGYGLTSFFVGGLTYAVFERLSGERVERPLLMLVASLWALAFVFGSGLLNLSATPFKFLDHVFATYLLFPLTVLYLAVFETARGGCGRRFAWLGDVTYSLYLLGFPLMLLVALVLRATGHSFHAVMSPLALAAFLAAAIPMAVACHRFFERPAQRWIRGRLSGRSATRLEGLDADPGGERQGALPARK